jgi:two-component system sensor histidine kinase UhpB
VVLTFDDSNIYGSISDDGLGITATDQEQPDQQHWGLITMRERAEAIGGHCQIESSPFLGTTVMVEVQR